MDEVSVLVPSKIGRADKIKKVILGPGPLSLEEFIAVVRYNAELVFSPEYIERVSASRELAEKFLAENKVDVAVLTVPKEAAISVTARLTGCGIDAIWNFTNLELTEPNSPTIVENIHFSDSLLSLSYYVAERKDEIAARAARAEKQ